MSATNVKASSVAANKSAELPTGNCFFFFHQWTKWVTFAEGRVLRRVNIHGESRIIAVGYWLRQRRSCPCCGLEQLRFEEKSAS